MLVVDASVLATALADDGGPGRAARSRLRGAELAAPAIIDLEVVSVLRGLVRGGRLASERAELALDSLREIRLRRAFQTPLLQRCWQLRDNLTPYDAAYVALAEVLDATLLTADARLSRSTGPRCVIDVFAEGGGAVD